MGHSKDEAEGDQKKLSLHLVIANNLVGKMISLAASFKKLSFNGRVTESIQPSIIRLFEELKAFDAWLPLVLMARSTYHHTSYIHLLLLGYWVQPACVYVRTGVRVCVRSVQSKRKQVQAGVGEHGPSCCARGWK